MSTGTTQSETLELTLKVSPVIAQHIRQQVSSGVYKTESDYVESLLLSDSLLEPITEEALVQWMNTEGVRRLEALATDPSSALTLDQAFAGLIDEDDEEA